MIVVMKMKVVMIMVVMMTVMTIMMTEVVTAMINIRILVFRCSLEHGLLREHGQVEITG